MNNIGKRMMHTKANITRECSPIGVLLNRLNQKIEQTRQLNPYPKLIIASHIFKNPYPLVNEVELLSLATMDLLIRFVYPFLNGYSSFTIAFTMKRPPGDEISFTLGSAIPLTNQDGSIIPYSAIFSQVFSLIVQYAEIYDSDFVTRLTIRAYLTEPIKKDMQVPSSEERERLLTSIMNAGMRKTEALSKSDPSQYRRNRKPQLLTALKPRRSKLKAFMVADTETILVDNVHKPYAAGLLMVRPGEDLNYREIDTYFSEDYSLIFDSFEERSTKVLYDLILRIESIVRLDGSTLTIYFHNFSRFDGILLLQHLARHHKMYTLKPLMRNHRLYELAVYYDKKILFRFRDSLNLLPGSLDSLAKNLCPELGTKGNVDHKDVNITNIKSRKNELLDYMKQDILLLGGIMKTSQEIYWKLYNVDLESKITLPSLALSIFRMKYYDPLKVPIHIPNPNEDSFIRRAYYGGHTDVYKPYGEDLYYYDVNSLYPFVMKEYPMPGGAPVWHRNLEGMDLDSLFGFIEAYVVCPKSIKKPFLPYRDKNNTLIFPTGEFVGVYYSEELKYARGLGYTVLPISGYLFEKMESPFKSFVSTLFASRLEARKDGNEAMAYVYKILMNSLYGRFGINPISTITDICDEDRFNHMIRHNKLIFSEMLSENKYIVAYRSNIATDTDHWKPPKNSAVQLSAAVTACARIYMYPYISRDDCYYTDTDSVVLGQPLPEEMISSTVLGKFKLEDKVLKGYFLAPKSYCYFTRERPYVLKYKGPAKSLVHPEWFEEQYANQSPARDSPTKDAKVEANFRIDWRKLQIFKKDIDIRLGIKLGTKRMPVYHGEHWVDTVPIDIEDVSSLGYIGKLIINKLRGDLKQLQNENLILNLKLDIQESEIEQRYKEMKKSYESKTDRHTQSNKERKTSTEDRTLLDKEERTEGKNLKLEEKTKTDEKMDLNKEEPREDTKQKEEREPP
jgi:hypothetical protein